MMINKFTALAILSVILMANEANSKEFRVSQIPNGAKNSCLNCHTSLNGGTRNVFGKIIEQKYLSGGNVVWNAELANLDSDGDGFTNGLELQDPNGTWISGTANPGTASKVSNPGVKTSIPTSVIENDYNLANNVITLKNIYPNPFIVNSLINFSVEKDGNLSVSIYTITGELIQVLKNDYVSMGNFVFNWSGLDRNGYELPAGIYLVDIKLDDASIIEKIYKVK